MQIILNGETKQVLALRLDALLEELKLEARLMAVELNMTVVPKSEYGSTELHENDRLEIVHMIGGG